VTAWRKSTHSQGQVQGECVEASTNSETPLIRDPKDPAGPRLNRHEPSDLVNKIKCLYRAYRRVVSEG
jgi:hypothetical protein